MRLAAAILVLCANAWAASPAGRPVASPSPDIKKAPAVIPEQAVPVKKVDEPVFKLPELVIIGENQARIMAQKEQMAGTPLSGLHEAPLLEKEEGAVTALRSRENAPTGREYKRGLSGILRAEGGTHGFLSGAGWLGVQEGKRMRGADFYADTISGEKAGPGRASGWNAGISLGGALVDAPKDPLKPSLADSFLPWLRADSRMFGLGWKASGRDLPYTGSAHRTMNAGYLAAETARGSRGFRASSLVQGAWLESPAGNDRMFLLGGDLDVPVKERGPLSILSRVRLQGGTARFAGGCGLAGTGLEAAWIPGERYRFLGGFSADIASGDGVSARSLRPLLGASWTTPAGPTLSARLSGGLTVPWPGRWAVESPYSFFPRMPAPVRELASLELSAWQETWDESMLRVDVRVRELRDALSWYESPGGLFAPAPVPQASIRELELSGRYNGWKPVAVYGAAVWREVAATAGLSIAGLANGNGRGGIEYAWREFTIASELEVGLVADRNILGGYLPPYECLNVRGGWQARKWLEVFARCENLLGDRMERWGGYPEPRRLVSGGVTGIF
jgi:hypothetical protein